MKTRYLLNRVIFWFFMYFFQHCFICRPSDSSVSEDAGIESRTVVTLTLAVRHSNPSARSHLHSARSHPHSVRSHPLSARYHTLSARYHPLSARYHPLSTRSPPLSAGYHPLSVRSHPLSARSHPQPAKSLYLSVRSHPHSARSHPLSARSHSHPATLILFLPSLVHPVDSLYDTPYFLLFLPILHSSCSTTQGSNLNCPELTGLSWCGAPEFWTFFRRCVVPNTTVHIVTADLRILMEL